MPAGRPKKPIDLEKVEILAKAGATDKEIAKEAEVNELTINRKKLREPEFSKSLKDWKEGADARVEASLYERACGYSHNDFHISNFQGEITLTPIVKHYAPDPTSMIFWLKNRQPDKWREKREIEISGQLDAVTEKEIDQKIQDMQNKIVGING